MNILKPINIEACGENSILVRWQDVISPALHQFIVKIDKALSLSLVGKLSDSIVGYNSLLLVFDFEKISHAQLIEKLTQSINASNDITSDLNQALLEQPCSSAITIPVYYYGYDLPGIAKQLNMPEEEVVNLHSNNHYRAYAQGFTPGFCYLAKVNNALILPRKIQPRKSVPIGAVAIAEQQSAVYPTASPGGWHILGVTPIAMLQKQNNAFEPTIKVGQTVKFEPICKDEFIALKNGQ